MGRKNSSKKSINQVVDVLEVSSAGFVRRKNKVWKI
jgi:hypothetical protein